MADLSAFSASTNTSFYLSSIKYAYNTSLFQLAVYTAPNVQQLLPTSILDTATASTLIIRGTNFVGNEAMTCNLLNASDALVYHSPAQWQNSSMLTCQLQPALYAPSSSYYHFYLSAGTYFNSSLIPFSIDSGAPYLPNTIYTFSDTGGNNGIFATSSSQTFDTQIVDSSGYNLSTLAALYTFNMNAADCHITFTQYNYKPGVIQWSYTAPPPPSSNRLSFACTVNFSVLASNDNNKLLSYDTRRFHFQSMMPEIYDVADTFHAVNTPTNFTFRVINLYIDDSTAAHTHASNDKFTSNISIAAQFTYAVRGYDIVYVFSKCAVVKPRASGFDTITCSDVAFSTSGQYVLQLVLKQYGQRYVSPPYNKTDSIILVFAPPVFDHVFSSNLTSVKHLAISGRNFDIGQNALNVVQWQLVCLFGEKLESQGHVVNDTYIMCQPPMNMEQQQTTNKLLHIKLHYVSYRGSQCNSTFNPIALTTNLSISFSSACGANCHNHGFCDFQAACHCDIGYAGHDCSMPLYFIILVAFSCVFAVTVLMLFFFCRKYRNKYLELRYVLDKRRGESIVSGSSHHIKERKVRGAKRMHDADDAGSLESDLAYFLCCGYCCCCGGGGRAARIKPEHESGTYTSTFAAGRGQYVAAISAMPPNVDASGLAPNNTSYAVHVVEKQFNRGNNKNADDLYGDSELDNDPLTLQE